LRIDRHAARVVPEPAVNTMSRNNQGNVGINIQMIVLMTSNSDDYILRDSSDGERSRRPWTGWLI
jgi:hypothetical protein